MEKREIEDGKSLQTRDEKIEFIPKSDLKSALVEYVVYKCVRV